MNMTALKVYSMGKDTQMTPALRTRQSPSPGVSLPNEEDTAVSEECNT